MGKNTNNTKEPSNEKNLALQELQEVPEVEESQPSQESPGEGSASVENGKEEPFLFTPMSKNEKPKTEETETEITIKKINVNLLKPHPQNEKIYGNEDVSDLVALIKEDGRIKEPLVVKAIEEGFIIISGHRRWLAAKKLGYESVPCEIREYASLEEELRDILSLNQKREKTKVQRVCEGLAWEDVYKKEASERSIANLKQNQSDMDKLSKSEEAGLTRDRIAKRVGLSSGKGYDRGKNVIKKIDELKRDGKNEDAELLARHLNKSVSGAEILAVHIASLSEDDKRNLRTGKVRLGAIVPKTKNEDAIAKSPSEYTLVMDQLKKIENAITVLNNLSTLGEDDKKKQKIQTKIEYQIESLQKILAASSSGEAKEE